MYSNSVFEFLKIGKSLLPLKKTCSKQEKPRLPSKYSEHNYECTNRGVSPIRAKIPGMFNIEVNETFQI